MPASVWLIAGISSVVLRELGLQAGEEKMVRDRVSARNKGRVILEFGRRWILENRVVKSLRRPMVGNIYRCYCKSSSLPLKNGSES